MQAGPQAPRLIVMLTKNDRTIVDAAEVFAELRELPIRCFGVKDVGLPTPQLERLIEAMRAAGKQVFLEIVHLERAAARATARWARDRGCHAVIGSEPDLELAAELRGHVRYFPYCGKVSGHPAVLDGSPEELRAHALELAAQGVDGVNLLAYRHRDPTLARPSLEQVATIRSLPVIAAGSIDSLERVRQVAAAGAWAFTIGGAFFRAAFVHGGSLAAQVLAVTRELEAAGR